MTAPGPSIWIVSDGRAGIERQPLSLARAIHARRPGEATTLRLQPKGLQVNLPPGLWPAPLSALPDDTRAKLKAPWPDIWIAAGRRAIPYSARVREWSGGKTLVVQTQDPRVSLGAFDLVIPPEHDRLAGTNVLPILGPPTWWSTEEIVAAQQRFPDLQAPHRRVLVSIGGKSKTHAFDADAETRILDAIRSIARDNVELWITVSRRTPDSASAALRLLAGQLGARFWENEARDGPNPYLAWLSMCDAALVTEDSANLLADPAFFAKPIHLIRLSGRSDRFDRLHKGFIDRGAARWFEDRIETWTYAPIREAERGADAILQALAGKHASPPLQKI